MRINPKVKTRFELLFGALIMLMVIVAVRNTSTEAILEMLTKPMESFRRGTGGFDTLIMYVFGRYGLLFVIFYILFGILKQRNHGNN